MYASVMEIRGERISTPERWWRTRLKSTKMSHLSQWKGWKYSGSKWLLPCFPLIFTEKKISMYMASLGENTALILNTASLYCRGLRSISSSNALHEFNARAVQRQTNALSGNYSSFYCTASRKQNTSIRLKTQRHRAGWLKLACYWKGCQVHLDQERKLHVLATLFVSSRKESERKKWKVNVCGERVIFSIISWLENGPSAKVVTCDTEQLPKWT